MNVDAFQIRMNTVRVCTIEQHVNYVLQAIQMLAMHLYCRKIVENVLNVTVKYPMNVQHKMHPNPWINTQ